ncbi:DUF1493 family protein [Apibacter raozihei]|uniref:DUF1493 family protein n=1 Tax=Apibacter raozihei TaxID=2500547 RepID=UPI0013E2B329|nr:DUF1493 family protein [Apibacter raozihei]
MKKFLVNRTSIENKVIDYFKRKFKGFVKIDENTILNKLYTTEDEIYFELVDYFEYFKIKINDFNILDYFYPELTLNLKDIWARLTGKNKRTPIPLLTIGHLIKVAEKGEWFEPE